ncbi:MULTISPECIES: carbamoyltransferase family protein [unclassified Maridesulfovibrio]|uniref:carbamoyltransferase family protein n=1 Tax=unclassified Maridesulfovibrio TaxID=2794999 RepID=UPI003B41F9FB
MNSYILGLHIGHDRGAALINNGKIVSAISEERLDRVKHSPADLLPELAIEYVLNESKISKQEITHIGITFGGNIIYEDVVEGWIRSISAEFDLTEDNIYFVGHHIAHAYSAYYTSPFSSCAIVVADGCGDVDENGNAEAESYYTAKNGKISLVSSRTQQMPTKYGSPYTGFRYDYMPEMEKDNPISIGRKYEQITKLIGFAFGQAGKTMGLAPYGDKMIKFDTATKGIHHSLSRKDYLEEIHQLYIDSGVPYKNFINTNKSSIAYDIQSTIEDLILSCISELASNVDTGNLCLAGGVFLNCVANKFIADSNLFKNIYIFPAAGDDGQALGAAFYVYNFLGGVNTPHKFSPFLGRQYTHTDCQQAITKMGLEGTEYNNENELVSILAEFLRAGKVLGILKGRSEMGPRALGNRSIIASPQNAKMRDHINKEIKCREDFRPFAPMTTYDTVSKYFDLDFESPYMLYTCQVLEEYKNQLPAITHVDGSARMQTVAEEDNPFVYKLLKQFGEYTDIPVLLNTSFNTAYEPIVESPEDALRTFVNSNLDVVVLENIVVKK